MVCCYIELTTSNKVVVLYLYFLFLAFVSFPLFYNKIVYLHCIIRISNKMFFIKPHNYNIKDKKIQLSKACPLVSLSTPRHMIHFPLSIFCQIIPCI